MKTTRLLSSERGSVLIVALILAAVVAISLGSYLKLTAVGLDSANRTLYNSAAMNIAENGLEEAVYAINKLVDDSTYSWTSNGWTAVGTTDMRRTLSGYTFDQNATGSTRVYVFNYNGGGGAPRAVARSTISVVGSSNKNSVEKWVLVQLTKTSKFASGLVAKDQIRFSGTNATVDSWNSDPDSNPMTPAIAYSAGVANDAGSVGSIAVYVDAVLVNNADIYGYVATGGSAPTVGSGGRIGPFGTPAGTIADGATSTDFSASFDAVTAPTATYTPIASITDNKILPDLGDLPAADGKYYYTCPEIDFNNKTLTITAGTEVVLKLTETGDAISVGGGSGVIQIDTGATLSIYTSGDISIAGQGISNGVDGADAGTDISTSEMGQPKQFQIWGTKTSGTQDIAIAGNGALSAIVYAPQGSVKINGNGDVAGSVVANDITVVGNASFHYDESLGDLDTGNPYRISSWSELTTASQRATYSSYLSF